MDTGAAVSVFPFNSSQPCTDLGLVTADGSNIRSWGQRSIIPTFAQRRFVWFLRLASVDRPILGADSFFWMLLFLRHCLLLLPF